MFQQYQTLRTVGRIEYRENTRTQHGIAIKRIPVRSGIHSLELHTSLKGPQFPALLEYAVEGERLSLYMNTIHGVSLDALSQHPSLFESVLNANEKIVFRALEAVQSLHAQGIYHRALTPAHIMVDTRLNVYIISYTQARIKANTSETAISGMSQFMAPEGILDPRAFSEASDLYSLGKVFLWLWENRLHRCTAQTVNCLSRWCAIRPEVRRVAEKDSALKEFVI